MPQNIDARIRQDGNSLYVFHGTEEKTFLMNEDLSAALGILKAINRLHTHTGLSIYETVKAGGFSAWSFHQSMLFWRFLVPYSRYLRVVEYISSNKLRPVFDESVASETKALISGIGSQHHRNLKSFIIDVLCRCIGVLSGIIAMLYAKAKGIKVLIYTPDRYDPVIKGDFRVEGLYNFVNKKQIHFIEIFHTVPGREFFSNMIRRRRPALYLEYLPLFGKKEFVQFAPIDLSSFPDYQKSYMEQALQTVHSYALTSARRYDVLRRILRFLDLKVFLSFDDIRYAQEIVAASRSLGIPSYGFQHGQYTKYHVGWMNYGIPGSLSATFDTLFVWNNYWLSLLHEYSEIYNGSNCRISGPIRQLADIERTPPPIPRNFSELKILVSFERSAPRHEIKKYLERFLKLGASLYLGVRPDIAVEEQVAKYGLKPSSQVYHWTHIDKGLLNKVHCVVGTYSTFLNEMMYYSLPVLLLKTSFDLGHHLREGNLVGTLDDNFGFEEIISYLKSYSSSKEKVWPSTGVDINDILESILKK